MVAERVDADAGVRSDVVVFAADGEDGAVGVVDFDEGDADVVGPEPGVVAPLDGDPDVPAAC